jgi:hypothetical protein
MKQYQLAVFGKQGCDKCDVLKKRLNKILADDTYSGFEFKYYDMGTSEGLVRFCQCEILNPQRIPSFMVFDTCDNAQVPIKHQLEVGDNKDPVDTYLAIETDYSRNGVISPRAIRSVLDKALNSSAAKV